MKKILLLVTFSFAMVAFAQKDELKTLKRIYDKEQLTTKDVTKYETALASLKKVATSESDKVYSNFYDAMLPLLKVISLGKKATQDDYKKVFNPLVVNKLVNTFAKTKNFEKTADKKIYTADINETISWFKPTLVQMAYAANSEKNYALASSYFYSVYKLDETEGSNLEKAAILALQAENYEMAERFYEKFITTDYFLNGNAYFAMNKATKKEEELATKEIRDNMLKIGSHQFPRQEKVNKREPEILQSLAFIYLKTNKINKAKEALQKARKLNPSDEEIKKEEARIYFNEAYEYLKDDQKIVDEINANLDNKEKYEQLMGKRQAIFRRTVPLFEKAYELNPTDKNTKALLKMAYEVVGLKDKAATIK